MAYYDDNYNWIDDDGGNVGVNDPWYGINRNPNYGTNFDHSLDPVTILDPFKVNANTTNSFGSNIFSPDNYGNLGGLIGGIGGLALGGNVLASGLGKAAGQIVGNFFGGRSPNPQSPTYKSGEQIRAEAIANGATVDENGNVRLPDGTILGPDFNQTANYVQQTLANDAQNQQIQDFVNGLNANALGGGSNSTGGSTAGGSTIAGSTTGSLPTTASTTDTNGIVSLPPYNVNENQIFAPTFNNNRRPGDAGLNFLRTGVFNGVTSTATSTASTTASTASSATASTASSDTTSTANNALQKNRNIGTEGASTIAGLNSILPSTVSTYSDAARGFSNADLENYRRMQAGIAEANARSTRQAAQQTREANTLLRQGNIQDVADNYQQALALRKAANPNLYSSLDQYTQQAQAQSAADQARIAKAGVLSREDTRDAQQAAREAWAARGMVNSEGAVGSEILNRDALIRQRQNEARAYGQQSSANLYNAAGANSANLFDPFGTILGQQYGMQTNNMGSNAQLFNQGAALSSGGLGNQYAQNVFNPFSQYANDVYGTNVNAYYANQIGAANNAAAIEGARLSGQYQKDAARNTAIYQSAPSIFNSLVKAFGG